MRSKGRWTRSRTAWVVVAILSSLGVMLIAGCGSVSAVKGLFGGDLRMEVNVSPRLNQNSALAVELIFVQDKKIVADLLELTARDWFRYREQFKRDHGRRYQSRRWEWIPEQNVPELQIKIPRGVETAFLFADFLAPGSHRQEISPREHFLLRLGENAFEVKPLRED